MEEQLQRVYLVWSEDSHTVAPHNDLRLFGIYNTFSIAKDAVAEIWGKYGHIDHTGKPDQPQWYYPNIGEAYAFNGSGFKWTIKKEGVQITAKKVIITEAEIADRLLALGQDEIDSRLQNLLKEGEMLETISNYSKSQDDGTELSAKVYKTDKSGWYTLVVGKYKDDGTARRTIRETTIKVNDADRNQKFNQARMFVDGDIKELPENWGSSVESHRPAVIKNTFNTKNVFSNEDLEKLREHSAAIDEILKKANE